MASKKELLMAAAKKSMSHMDKATLQGKTYVENIKLNDLIENPYQPRITMDPEKLKELSLSIKKDGLLQPVVVSKLEDNSYMILAGHRRVAAHKLLNLDSIKALVLRDVCKSQQASIALVENIQRENLNYVELAMQYRVLIDQNIFKNISALAEAIGKDPGDIGKIINLLNLSSEILEDIKDNNTITDIKILDALRKIKEDEKQKYYYEWYLENRPSREDFLKEIKKGQTKKEKASPYSIKNSKKSCTVKLPRLSAAQIEKLEEFIKQTLKEQ